MTRTAIPHKNIDGIRTDYLSEEVRLLAGARYRILDIDSNERGTAMTIALEVLIVDDDIALVDIEEEES